MMPRELDTPPGFPAVTAPDVPPRPRPAAPDAAALTAAASRARLRAGVGFPPALATTTCLIGNFAGPDLGPHLIESVSTSAFRGHGLPEAVDDRGPGDGPDRGAREDGLMAGRTIV